MLKSSAFALPLIFPAENAELQVYSAETGQQGLVEVGTRKPDIAVLDLGLPDMDGVEVLAQFVAGVQCLFSCCLHLRTKHKKSKR